MDGNDIDIIARDTVFQGYFRVDRYRVRHRLFGGGWSGTITREVFERGHSVAVLLFDPVADAVVLVEQFRAGAVAAGLPPWQIECAAGIMGAGETPEEVARREAGEETACHVRRLEPIGPVIYSPGGCSEICRIFVGEIDSAGIGGVHGLEAENEDIKVHVLPALTAIAWLDAGKMSTGALLIAMLWFARHHERLRARWLEPQNIPPESAS
jgi:ADP-ribose pyrophosphatase